MLMLSEIGQGGDWSWAFQAPYLDKYGAPTVEGIDFPFMGVRQAWNDASSGVLHVSTYAVTSDRREQETTFRVTNVPDTEEVFVLIDGQPFDRFEVEGPGVIRLDSDIGEHRYQIFTGYRGSEVLDPQASRTQQMSKSAGALALASRPTSKNDRAGTSDLLAGPPPVCGCC